jgi:DNA-binding response OmpR family regulator
MRALVVDGDVAFAKEVARGLQSRAEVETVHDGLAALAAMRARPFDLVISEWLLPTMEGVTLLRAMREAGAQAPFIICTVLNQREARDYAIAAGAAEVLTKPVSAEAVAAAAFARLSMSRLSPAPSVAMSAAASAGDNNNSPLGKFCSRVAWRDAGKTLLKGLAAATGQALEEVSPANASPTEVYDARTTLAMVDVRSRIRLELGLFTTFSDGAALVTRALRLDSPRHEDVTEFFSEMCNQALGAVKSAMRTGGMNFTLSVPRARFVQGAGEWATQFPLSRTVHVVQEAGSGMMLVLGARPCTVKTIEVSALRENMVIVDDLRDDDGSILAEAASRLTAHTLVRIKTRAAGRRVPIVE